VVDRNRDKLKLCCREIDKTGVIARPRGFEPLTLGLEMQGIGYTNDIVLHRFVILQYLFYRMFTKMAYRLTV
jgi:hypothetical protein